jgi:beta-phosphoglucomutase-like phosphatase (HAD superfamily)
MDFNAAIFDLDGTILDSMDVWEHIDIQFLKKRNLPVPENYVTEIRRLRNATSRINTAFFVAKLK